jgi:hypothetical protein
VLLGLRLGGEFVTPEISPYAYVSQASSVFKAALERLVPFGELGGPLDRAGPRLLVSAADVETG